MINSNWLDKAYEGKKASELVNAPVDALQGVSENDAKKLKEAFGIDNIKEMANLKYFKRARILYNEAKENENA